jgi:hypothetical protein
MPAGLQRKTLLNNIQSTCERALAVLLYKEILSKVMNIGMLLLAIKFLRRKLWIALCGELALEEALDLS